MTDITIQKLTKKQREQVRWLYFGNHQPLDIATKTGIDIDTIRFLIFGEDGTGKDKTSLFAIRKSMDSVAMSTYFASKKDVFDQTTGIALATLNMALMKLHQEVVDGKELNLDDLKKLSGIVLDMDKVVRLESGQATDTIQHMGLTTAEAKQILQDDPFASEIIDAEFTEKEGLPWLKE